MTRRFEFVEEGSSKFWEVNVEGSVMTVRYGKIGTDGQLKAKTLTEETAPIEAAKLIAEKTKKGYTEVTGGAAAPAGPSGVGAKEVIEGVHKTQRDRWGLTLGQLLRCWVKVFSQRPDVQVLTHEETHEPLGMEDLSALVKKLPGHALAFSAQIGSLEFNWAFEDQMDEQDGRDEGSQGGRICLYRLGGDWEDNPYEWELDESVAFAAQQTFDAIAPEGAAKLHYVKNPSDAAVVFEVEDPDDWKKFRTIEAYLTAGAKQAFTWYWPVGESTDFVEKLCEGSIPKSTPKAKVITALVEKGLSDAEASAMHSCSEKTQLSFCTMARSGPTRETRSS